MRNLYKQRISHKRVPSLRSSSTGAKIGAKKTNLAEASAKPPEADASITEMCSGSEVGSYLRLIDVVYHSTLGLRVIKKKKNESFRFVFSRECGSGHLLSLVSCGFLENCRVWFRVAFFAVMLRVGFAMVAWS